MYLLVDFGYKELTLKAGTFKFEKVLQASKKASKKFKDKAETSKLYASLNRAGVEREVMLIPKPSKQNQYLGKAISASNLENKLLNDKIDYNTKLLNNKFNKK